MTPRAYTAAQLVGLPGSRVEFRSIAQILFAANQLPSFKGGIDRACSAACC